MKQSRLKRHSASCRADADKSIRRGTTSRHKETVSRGNVATATSTVSTCSQSCNNVCIARNITCYSNVWQALAYGDHIFSIVNDCKLEFRHPPWQMEVHRLNKLSSKESIIANTEIKYFLRKWVIRKVTHELEFLTIFTKPPQIPPSPPPIPQNGSHRLILKLKKLNEHTVYHKLQMDSLQSTTLLMKPHCWMAETFKMRTIVPVWNEVRKYRFEHEHENYFVVQK